MPSYREAVLVHLSAQRRERHGMLWTLQETMAEALRSQANGHGAGPSTADCERLAQALAASEHADTVYLRMLSYVGDEIIAKAQSSARSRH